MYEMTAKDVRYAATAAGLRGLTLPVTSVIGELIGPRLMARDQMLAARGTGPIERCPVCKQELAYPFRVAGVHPECQSEG